MKENVIWYVKKYGILAALILVEVIFLIIVGSRYEREKLHVDIPYTDLVGTTIPDNRDGWYVDETFPLEASGMFDYTEDIALPRGTYDITVRYETDTDKNYCTTTATTKYFRSLRTDKTPLQCRTNEITYTIYILEDVEDFRIETYFGREGYMIIKGFSIQETRALARIEIFLLLLLSLFVDAVYIVKQRRLLDRIPRETLCAAVGIAGIALLASLPALVGFYVRRYDTPFHMLRIEGIKEGLLQGQFPVKIQPNWVYGYGYPVSVYYGDLFLYIPALLRIIGFPVHTSYNFLLVLTNIMTAAIAYISLHKVVKERYIALAGAMLYTLAPYRLMTMYNRSGLGEVLAVTFLPLIVYGIYAAFTGDTKEKGFKYTWVPMVIGFSGVIQSHTLTCILCALFILPLCVVKIKRTFQKERFLVLAKTVIYTTLLNLWFILPFITSMESLAVVAPRRKELRIQYLGTKIPQLFNLLYKGYGDGSVEGIGTVTLGVGMTLGMALFLFPALSARMRKRGGEEKAFRQMKVFFWMSVVSLLLTTIYFPWDYLAELFGKYNMWIVNIQFPWRFLEISCVLLVFLFAIGMKVLKESEWNRWLPSVLVLFIGLGIVSGMSEIDGHVYSYSPNFAYDIDALGLTGDNVTEYLIEGTDSNVLKPGEVVLSENVSLWDYEKQGVTVSFTCENQSGEEGYVELPLLWYSNYRAKDMAGESLTLTAGNNNVIRVSVPAGYFGDVTVKYQHLVSWRIAEIISLVSLLGFGGYAFYIRRKNRKECLV